MSRTPLRLRPTRSRPPVRETIPTSYDSCRRFRLVDLFCGAGGFSQGFREAGFEILAGVDQDPDALATFRLNFPRAEAIHGDLRDEAIHARVLEAARSADVVVGGPPCQAFSQVRNHDRLIHDPRNSLYREFVAVIAELLPIAFVMENVPGLQQMGVEEQVAEDLSLDSEYRVRSFILDAADFGVPQTRRRLLFVGIRRSFAAALPTLIGTQATDALSLARDESGESRYRVAGRESLLNRNLLARLRDPSDLSVVTVRQAIGDLAFLRAGSRVD